ncbi:MAG: hypothetical protein AAF518_18310 [Spirochaetota bacterium]
MANSFSNTTKAIEADSFYSSVVILSIVIILLSAWINWFMNARISVFETSVENMLNFSSEEITKTQFLAGARPVSTKQRKLIASFAGNSSKRIKRGQKAFVHFKDKKKNRTKKFQAVVKETKWDPKKKMSIVKLIVSYNDTLPDLKAKYMLGFVNIEVGYTTPANIAIKAVGID